MTDNEIDARTEPLNRDIGELKKRAVLLYMSCAPTRSELCTSMINITK